MTTQRITARIRQALDHVEQMHVVAVVIGERDADIDYDSLYRSETVGLVKITDESLTSADNDGVLLITTTDFDDQYDRIRTARFRRASSRVRRIQSYPSCVLRMVPGLPAWACRAPCAQVAGVRQLQSRPPSIRTDSCSITSW
ncbi:hypothetical protein [Pseudoclavibacter sp. CFCC 13611]|uniref:hypothetical protein n=1 Tax=Pseudoclavibacter sp. CFCC 13611 TaxID=2615178 RepID=UPI001300EBED|nr:hypothetical protein [Pseudoclavibacter sp. CFCC 13611]KAB1663599.1 hypothetical protein F8O08_07695 [Pseudoclavibacter sp. CFCC 13611]